jgi:hypothetical protein
MRRPTKTTAYPDPLRRNVRKMRAGGETGDQIIHTAPQV